MRSAVNQVDSLWKNYRLGVLGTGTLRHDFNRWLHRVVGKPDPYAMVGAPTKSEDRRSKSEGEAPKGEERRAKSEEPAPLSPLRSPISYRLRWPPSPLSFVNRLSSANALGRHMRPIRLPRGPFRTSISPEDERGGEEHTAETRAFA